MTLPSSPAWLFIAVPYLGVVSYLTYRGVVRHEFRVGGKSGWVRYPAKSYAWWTAHFLNFVLLGSGLFVLYWGLFKDTGATREPPRPDPRGQMVASVWVDREPASLVACLADLNHAQSYSDRAGGWLLAVRNGRNKVMYTFEVEPQAQGSQLIVRREQVSPFVTWKPCVRAE